MNPTTAPEGPGPKPGGEWFEENSLSSGPSVRGSAFGASHGGRGATGDSPLGSTLALEGGRPVRKTLLPYGRQSISDEDVSAVSEVLKSDWITTGPKVEEFERAFAACTGSEEAVAVSNGTAALHTALFAAGVREGDEVIVPTMTFASTANAIMFLGGTPIFVDSDPETLLVDPQSVESSITQKTKVIVAVDYAGQPCDYDALTELSHTHNLTLIADACHALGGSFHGKPVGSLAHLSTFSFHPVKPITTGEGGMITTDDEKMALTMRQFRNHCLTSDHRERQEKGSWFYEMKELGMNYRLTDFQCALGMNQLRQLPQMMQRRQEIAQKYDEAFREMDAVAPLKVRDNVFHAHHLYVVQLNLGKLSVGRSEIFKALRAENIGVNVHYIPVHLHPYYRERFGTKEGLCPVAEAAYERMLTLPLFAGMEDEDASDVITAVKKVCSHYCA